MSAQVGLVQAQPKPNTQVEISQDEPAQEQSPYYYYYFDRKLPLELDVTRIAVLRDKSAPMKGLPSLGITSSNEKALAVSRWSTIVTPVSERSMGGIQNLIRQASEDRDIRFISPAFTDQSGGELIVTPSILVGFTAETSSEQAEEILLESNSGTITERNWANMKGVYRLSSSFKNGFEVMAAANALAELPEVRFAEPDFIFTGGGALFPNDPGFPDCWGIHNTGQLGGTVDMDMDGPEAWDINTGDPSIIVVVIDVGVQQNHPDINQRAGADFTSDAGDGGPVNSYDNHGTPVAGCISATINNSLGTVGIAPNSLVASARTFIATNSSGNWTSQASWTVNALAWAESIGAKVTNNSNYYGFTSSSIATKYEQTRNNGIVHFAIAGNNSSSSIVYPGSLPTVNAIAALDGNGNLTSFSNYGNGLAFSAPGEDIYTTDRTGSDGWTSEDYTWAWGTSFASPYTAGVAALVFSRDPNLNAMEVEQILQQSSIDLGVPGYDTTFGWGFVNAYRAVLPVVSGRATCGSVGLGDVVMSGLPGDPCTNSTGYYTAIVDFSWGGTVEPTKGGYTFEPNSITYLNVTTNQKDQDYEATNIYDLDGDGVIGWGEVSAMSDNWLETGPNIPGDFYKDETDTVNFQDFALLATYWNQPFE